MQKIPMPYPRLIWQCNSLVSYTDLSQSPCNTRGGNQPHAVAWACGSVLAMGHVSIVKPWAEIGMSLFISLFNF
jgi:hypothetical protein